MNIEINVVNNAVLIKSLLEEEDMNCSYGETSIPNWDKPTSLFVVSLSTYSDKAMGYSCVKDNGIVNNFNLHRDGEICFYCKSNRQAILLSNAIQFICDRYEKSPSLKLEDIVKEKFRDNSPYYHYVELVVDPYLFSLREEPKKDVNYSGAYVYISNPDKVIYKSSNKSLNKVSRSVSGTDLSDEKVSLGTPGTIIGRLFYNGTVLYLVNTDLGMYICPPDALTLGIRRIRNG